MERVERERSGKNRPAGLSRRQVQKDEEKRSEKIVLLAGEKSFPLGQQALPRRGWVAPRRPRINKTTARPSPVLGPSCLASACRGLPFARATPDDATRACSVIPVALSATRQSLDAAAPRCRAALRCELGDPRARSLARVRDSRRGSIFNPAVRSVCEGKFAESAFAEFDGFTREFRNGHRCLT